MKAIALREAFGIENLTLEDRPDPKPGHGEVVVRMRAASLNYRDLLMVRGHYDPRQPLPLIPLSDGCGVVEAVGPGVTRFAEGDRVAGIFAQKWLDGTPTKGQIRSTLGGPLDGTLSELRAFPEDGLVHAPASLTDAEVATLPCAAVTAWSALVTQANLSPGSRVLVLGTGGVSLFALQIARAMGCEVIVTSSSDEKLERARQLGATHLINYREHPRWSKEVKRVTNGEHVDLVVEVGGAGTFDESAKSVRVGGQISLIGVLAQAERPPNLTRILMQNIRVQGILVGHRRSFEDLNRALEANEIRPVIDRTFPWKEAGDALEYLARGKHFGKIVLEWD